MFKVNGFPDELPEQVTVWKTSILAASHWLLLQQSLPEGQRSSCISILVRNGEGHVDHSFPWDHFLSSLPRWFAQVWLRLNHTVCILCVLHAISKFKPILSPLSSYDPLHFLLKRVEKSLLSFVFPGFSLQSEMFREPWKKSVKRNV